jgi:hypothetical protein
MISRRSLAAGVIAGAALAALRIDPRPIRHGFLSGVDLGVGPLAVDELTTLPRLPVAALFGRKAVLLDGRFLGWVPPGLRVSAGGRIRVQEVRLDQTGRLLVKVADA